MRGLMRGSWRVMSEFSFSVLFLLVVRLQVLTTVLLASF
jgi:hypothetical protein